MVNKITEKILEPTQKYVDSSFLLKIKVIKYFTYEELTKRKYNEINEHSYNNLKGE